MNPLSIISGKITIVDESTCIKKTLYVKVLPGNFTIEKMTRDEGVMGYPEATVLVRYNPKEWNFRFGSLLLNATFLEEIRRLLKIAGFEHYNRLTWSRFKKPPHPIKDDIVTLVANRELVDELYKKGYGQFQQELSDRIKSYYGELDETPEERQARERHRLEMISRKREKMAKYIKKRRKKEKQQKEKTRNKRSRSNKIIDKIDK